MIAPSVEPRLKDIVEAIGYIRSDMENATLESLAVTAGSDGRSSEVWKSSRRRAAIYRKIRKHGTRKFLGEKSRASATCFATNTRASPPMFCGAWRGTIWCWTRSAARN
jgi:hypothetical protein